MLKTFTKLKTLVIAGVLALAGVFGVVATPQLASAAGYRDGIESTSDEFEETDLKTTVKNVINVILYVVGLLAVVMVIIGGVQYTTSGGDSAAVTKAKNTILYGIVGLAIAILAYAIVNFVIGKLLA